jgi:ubiquinone/menaquinone biosynthesis C-methylase UbiE
MKNKHDYVDRPLNPHRLSAIKKFGGQSFLDVGCGNGAYVYEFMRQKNVHGLDYKTFESWGSAPDLFSVGDVTSIDYDDSSFDTVTAFEVLEHVKDYEKALAEMRRVCKDNLILTVPNCYQTEGMKKSNLLYGHYSDPTHTNFWGMLELKEIIQRSGFDIVHAEYINRINVHELVSEALGLSPFFEKLLKNMTRKDYFMTLLIVANKI